MLMVPHYAAQNESKLISAQRKMSKLVIQGYSVSPPSSIFYL